MKSRLNFIVKKDGKIFNMHELGIWVSSFHIYSPNPTRNKLVVPGRPGAYLVGTQEEERHVRIALQIEADDLQEFDGMKHKIFELFYSEEPFSIIRDIAPDKEIFVLQEGEYDIENLSDSDGEFEITLTMLDPYLCGPEKEAFFPSDVVSLPYNGTAPGDPIFEMEVLQPVTFAMIQNQNKEYMMIGKPIDVETQVPVQREERILWDQMATTTGWAVAEKVDGAVAGSIESTGYAFQPKDYGTGTGWHGPALKKSLSEVVTDFHVEAIVELYNGNPAMIGRVEIYLLDESGNIIGKIALKDVNVGSSTTYGEVRIGDGDVNYHLIDETGEYPWTWNNFYGILRIGRHNGEWFAYIAKIDQATGKHHSRMYHTYTDTDKQFTKNLAQIAVHFGQMGTYKPANVRIQDIKVYKWNPITQSEIPYIAQTGDIITFDHTTKDILINGESRKDLKDFGARFFELVKGENQFVVLPSNSFAVRVKYRERFL